MEKIQNPFPIHAYQGPEYFCDREEETETLTKNARHGSNTACFAQRRMGKTALIIHTLNGLKNIRGIHCIYLDIYATQNLKDFTNQLAAAIYRIFPESKSPGKRFLEYIRLFRPVISFDALSGMPEMSLGISKPEEIERSIPPLLQFLDQQPGRTIIAIDEFQQILQYPEKKTEALLRTCIQQLKRVNFIFCGSNQRLMHDLFQNARRPFYASVKNLQLEAIQPDKYSDFIKKHFEKNHFQLSIESIGLILELTCHHTYYTQYLCHELFAQKHKRISREVVQNTLQKILEENEGTWFQYRNLLTAGQWRLLRALAREEKIEKPYSKDFIGKYNLGTPSLVKRGLESLLQKEMVYHHAGTQNSYYEVYDKFLLRWLQQKQPLS